MPYELCVFSGAQVSRVPLWPRSEFSIGRAEGNDIRIDDPSVSRRHAVLSVGEKLVIRDLGSVNGTVVGNGHQAARPDVTANIRRISGQSAEVAVGDPISFGVVMIVVQRVNEPSGVGGADSQHSVVEEESMLRLHEQAARAAASPISILILGETGVGKEVLARSIHRRSPRASKPFMSLNCGALAESIIEGELFGHEKGAFTGAVQARPGLFEAADGGTVFLDEVGELPLATQAKLLRVLEDRSVMRLGARRTQSIDVRFVSATNRDLETVSNTGGFRQDLYFRLNGISLTIPPLRERQREIEPLALHFVQAACRAMDRPDPPRISPTALEKLREYAYPGNVRELRNVIDRAVVLCSGSAILPEHLPPQVLRAEPRAVTTAPQPSPLAGTVPPPFDPTAELRAQVKEIERARIERALAECGGNQTQAAKLLGISRRTLVTRLGEFELPRPRRPRDP